VLYQPSRIVHPATRLRGTSGGSEEGALSYPVKRPLVYTHVAIRNWTWFQKLGVRQIMAPGSYHTHAALDFRSPFGGYSGPKASSRRCWAARPSARLRLRTRTLHSPPIDAAIDQAHRAVHDLTSRDKGDSIADDWSPPAVRGAALQ